MKRLFFILNFLYVTPKIVVRLIWFAIKKKKFSFQEFRPTNIVSIDGALNQLVWYLENPIFLSISNSSKIYFNSDEFVFKVSKSETEFIFKAYTFKGIKKFKTSIKVICLNQKSFDGLSLSDNMVKLRRKSIKLNEKELVAKKLSKVRNTKLSRMNLLVKTKTAKMNSLECDTLNSILETISNSKNEKELTYLK